MVHQWNWTYQKFYFQEWELNSDLWLLHVDFVTSNCLNQKPAIKASRAAGVKEHSNRPKFTERY